MAARSTPRRNLTEALLLVATLLAAPAAAQPSGPEGMTGTVAVEGEASPDSAELAALFREARADLSALPGAKAGDTKGELLPHPLGGWYTVMPPGELDVMVAVDGGPELAATCTSAASLTDETAAAWAGSPGPTVVLRRDESRLRGADAEGRPFLWAPDPAISGSSLTHWDPTAFPDLLMEPSVTAGGARHDLDLTVPALLDLGWRSGTLQPRIESGNNHHAGMRDPRPFAGAPGNPATTLGQARANALGFALQKWAAQLGSTVPLEVLVVFRPLACREGIGAVLGAAASRFAFADVPGLPRPRTLYPAPLAEALVGEPLNRGLSPFGPGEDVFVTLNSSLDDGCLGAGHGFYYGLDGRPGPGEFDFVTVVLHEVAHALGLSNQIIEPTGERFRELPAIHEAFTLDTTLGRSLAELEEGPGLAAAAARTRRLVWSGAAVADAAPAVLEPGVELVELRSGSPPDVFVATPASYGPRLDATGLEAELACFVDDDAAPSRLDGCSAPLAPGELAGRIALVHGGTCDSSVRAAHAASAGALALVVMDRGSDAPRPPSGETSAIPVLVVGRGDGRRLAQTVCDQVVRLRGGRFEVSARWHAGDASGVARGGQITDTAAYLTFFTPDNVELVVKVLDGCGAEGTGSQWVFASALTTLGFELTVSDLVTGRVWTRRHEGVAGRPFRSVFDTGAFPCS